MIRRFLLWALKWTFELIPIILIIWVFNISFKWLYGIWAFISKVTFLNKILPNHDIWDSIISILLFLLIAYFFNKLTKKGLWKLIHIKFDKFLRKFPLLGKIYRGWAEMIGIIKENKENNKKNIIVAIKYDDSFSLGFVVYNKNLKKGNKAPVFIPDPPIPTGWSLNIMEKKRILVLDTTWEDATKYLLSLGANSSESMIKNIENLENLPTLDVWLNHW